jgi:hypothetical protein
MWNGNSDNESYLCLASNGRRKASYRSQAVAKQAARRLKAKRQRQYPYKCPTCEFWHLTSAPTVKP